MNCKNLRIRSKNYYKYFYCIKKRQKIDLNVCNGCFLKEYKTQTYLKKHKNSSYKKEKERYSIITSNLDNCFICGKKQDHLHEVFFGKNRQASIKYGCVIPLCFDCHHLVHHNHDIDLKLKQKMREVFEKKYPKLDFISIFGQSYKKK